MLFRYEFEAFYQLIYYAVERQSMPSRARQIRKRALMLQTTLIATHLRRCEDCSWQA